MHIEISSNQQFAWENGNIIQEVIKFAQKVWIAEALCSWWWWAINPHKIQFFRIVSDASMFKICSSVGEWLKA